MSTYLVTGGAGFIGSHLADKIIENGSNVIILDNFSDGKKANVNPKCELVEGSILDRNLLKDIFKKVDFCYHLAATASVQKSISSWPEAHANNLTGTINIFSEAAERDIPVIYASSAAIYGTPTTTPISEDDAKEATSPYGLDKYCCEKQAMLFGKLKNLRSIGLRFFNVYGKRQDPSSPYSGVISIFLDKIQNGETITIYGDGQQERDFIFIDDVVKALLASQNFVSIESDIYNVCTGTSTTINDLLATIAGILNKKPSIEYLPTREGDIYRSIGNPSKLKKLNISDFVDIREGLRKII